MSDVPVEKGAMEETEGEALARGYLTPECLSAALLVSSNMFGQAPVTDVIRELSRQTAAINSGDMTQAENMLMAQAHTLNAIHAHLASKALMAKHMDDLESYMRLSLKAQNQARATLQTLNELKAPKQIAFVQQANIGNQVQVNNGVQEKPARARKTKKVQNELLEVEHGERLDTRATSTAGGANPELATLGGKHRTTKCGG